MIHPRPSKLEHAGMRRRPWDRPNVNLNLRDSALVSRFLKLSILGVTPARRDQGDVRAKCSGKRRTCQREPPGFS